MKSILMVSSVLILSIASVFTQSEINLTFDAPTSVTAGESFILKIDVDKGDISNFAKLQLNLPEGFTAELLDGKGGTFTFYDQKMKLIWISLPSDEKFTVQVKVNTDKTIAGDFNFNGKISYVIDGERKSKDIVTQKFNVSPNANTGAPNKTVAGTSGTGINVGKTGKAELTCSRSFDATQIAPGETFLVELKISKSNVSGVGKIIENIPNGFTAQEVESNGAIFSQKGDQVKFLWMTLPAEDEFTVSYKIVTDQGLSGNKVIDGKMSYLDGSDTKNYLIDGTSIEITDNPVASNDTGTSTDSDNGSDDNSGSDSQSTDTGNDVQADASQDNSDSNDYSDENTGNDNGTTADASTDSDNGEEDYTSATTNHQVNYRVQICALRKQIPTGYFVKNHQITEHIYLNMHEGWHKYTVGDYKAYKGARDHREVIRDNKKIKGPFVTAYNNGSRITVQEALMITKDKWVQ